MVLLHDSQVFVLEFKVGKEKSGVEKVWTVPLPRYGKEAMLKSTRTVKTRSTLSEWCLTEKSAIYRGSVPSCFDNIPDTLSGNGLGILRITGSGR